MVPGSRQPNNFAEEHHSRPSVGFGEFSSQNSGGNTSFGARPSSHPPPFLPNEIPSFHSPASQRSLQQHFGSGGAINQTISDYSIPTGGPNFDMMLYDGGMNGTGNGHQMMMNGGGEFLGDFGPSRDMPAQYVLSNELLCRIDNSTKKQSLLELQIGLEQIAYETSTNFNTWATVIKDRLNVTGRESLSEMDKFIATEMLVEMSIVLDESQYNFSRLCQFLATNIDKYGPNILLPQVSAFVSETNTLLSPQHLRNLVTFLAELYDKIEINGVKSSQLAAHLFDQLHNVLKLNPLDDQSIGTIVKILKLTGRFLENDRGPQAMDEFFAELGETSRNSSDSAKSKVKNLVALRDKQWGIVAETITSGNSSAYPLVGILGPDGEQLTEEECNLFDDTFDNFGNSPSGSLYNNPMEEDNVEDDYEQFLQATAIRAAEKALEKVSIDEDDESILSSPKLFSGKQL